MAGKNFKGDKPFDVIGKKEQIKTPTKIEPQQKPIPEKITEKKSSHDYLRLNITGYREYLSVMAGHHCKSITKYIQSLIDADMEQNKETYEKIKSI